MDQCPTERLIETLGLSTDFEPAYDPVGEVVVSHEPSHGRAEIRYVALDPLPPRRFWPTDGSRGKLVPLRGRDAAVESDGAALVLPVRVSPDGARIAMPTGMTRENTHLFVPPPERTRAVAEGRESLGSLLDWSRRQVSAFDSWKRGEVYGIVREMLVIGADGSATQQDVATDWLRLDEEAAHEVLADSVEPPAEPSPFRP